MFAFAFQYNILFNQQIVLALGTGVAFVIITILTYLAVWRPRTREAQQKAETEPLWRAAYRYMPYVILFFLVATACVAVLFYVTAVFYPPNW